MINQNNVIDFQKYRDKLEEKFEEIKLNEAIAELSDEIDLILDNIELICIDKNDIALTLLEIRNYLDKLIDSRLFPEEHEDK